MLENYLQASFRQDDVIREYSRSYPLSAQGICGPLSMLWLSMIVRNPEHAARYRCQQLGKDIIITMRINDEFLTKVNDWETKNPGRTKYPSAIETLENGNPAFKQLEKLYNLKLTQIIPVGLNLVGDVLSRLLDSGNYSLNLGTGFILSIFPPSKNRNAHTLALYLKKKDDKLLITLFDSNIGEMSFPETDACLVLTQLMQRYGAVLTVLYYAIDLEPKRETSFIGFNL